LEHAAKEGFAFAVSDSMIGCLPNFDFTLAFCLAWFSFLGFIAPRLGLGFVCLCDLAIWVALVVVSGFQRVVCHRSASPVLLHDAVNRQLQRAG
jgi:uncharacterized membrane protein